MNNGLLRFHADGKMVAWKTTWRNIGPAIFWYYRVVNAGQTRYSARQRATVPSIFLELRGFEPKPKRFGVHPLTSWAKLPFDT